jgi:hypothetical protein
MTQMERDVSGDDAAAAVETLPEAHRVMLRKTAWVGRGSHFALLYFSPLQQASLRRRTSCVHKDCGHGRRSSRALTELQRHADTAAPVNHADSSHSYPSGSIQGTNKFIFEVKTHIQLTAGPVHVTKGPCNQASDTRE